MEQVTCSIDGCTDDEARRGWCNKHYLRWRRHGDPLAGAAFLLGHSDLPGERWVPVASYEGLYEVSNLGRIRSLPNKGRPGHLLRLSAPRRQEHYRIRLYRSDGTQTHLVHRLVAAAFIGPCPEGMEVRHLDGDYLNNASTNLAYGTHAENMQDAILHGTNHEAKRTRCPQDHPYDEVNTYVTSMGRRQCRACRTVQSRESKRRARVA